MEGEKEEYEVCPEPPEPFVNIVQDGFGFFFNEKGDNEVVRRYTFTNQRNLTVQIISYGARVTTIKYPDKNGIIEDIVLGFDDLSGYVESHFGYFGATIGRVANRISKGHFRLGNEDYQLTTNLGEHHFHGGFKGFDKVNWKSEIQDKKVVMSYLSKDGEEGYPGEVLVSVSYELTTNNDLIYEVKATCAKATPINVCHNLYFNLGGHSKGSESVYEHEVSINADRFCQTDENFIPTGLLKNVVNTLWDLRIPRRLGTILPNIPYGGYDQNLCIHKTGSECISFNARVVHPISGRLLEIYSNQPGIQFYTCNFFPKKTVMPLDPNETDVGVGACQMRRCPLCGQLTRDPDFENEDVHSGENSMIQIFSTKPLLIGKDEAEYYRHGGISLMPQHYTDFVHRKNFPSCILKPGETYYHITKYKFGLFEEAEMYIEEEVVTETESEIEAAEQEEKGENELMDDLLDEKLEENGR